MHDEKIMAYYYSPFRSAYEKPKQPNTCVFCVHETMYDHAIRDNEDRVQENESAIWVVNYFPKFEGHTMVVPKRHVTSLDEETPKEVTERGELIRKAAGALQQLYPGAGIEVFLQAGPGSASSIQHLHWHVVPALPDDPLRSFEKLGHFYTTNDGMEKVVLFPILIRTARAELQAALARTLTRGRL